MHRREAEGRFGEAEPAGRASVCARARTLGVNMLSENAFKEMPTLADKSSDFDLVPESKFTSGRSGGNSDGGTLE